MWVRFMNLVGLFLSCLIKVPSFIITLSIRTSTLLPWVFCYQGFSIRSSGLTFTYFCFHSQVLFYSKFLKQSSILFIYKCVFLDSLNCWLFVWLSSQFSIMKIPLLFTKVYFFVNIYVFCYSTLSFVFLHPFRFLCNWHVSSTHHRVF